MPFLCHLPNSTWKVVFPHLHKKKKNRSFHLLGWETSLGPLKCFHSGWFEFTNKWTLNIETKKTNGRKRPSGPSSLPSEFLFSFYYFYLLYPIQIIKLFKSIKTSYVTINTLFQICQIQFHNVEMGLDIIRVALSQTYLIYYVSVAFKI